MTYPVFSRSDLESKNLVELKAIAASVDAIAQDKRSKSSWVEAILSKQPHPIQSPTPLPQVGDKHFTGNALIECVEVAGEYATKWDVYCCSGNLKGWVAMKMNGIWRNSVGESVASVQQAISSLLAEEETEVARDDWMAELQDYLGSRPLSKTLIIIRGTPGSGKTSLAHKISGAPALIAADDFPGLYINGVYQTHLQKDSHEWCVNSVEEWMRRHATRIVVHNTFVELRFMQPYLDLASKHEYAVHVVHSEGVVLPNGDRATSVHHVPQAVVDSMKQRWQPFNPPSKKGITPAQIAQQMKGLKVPHSIIFDMDGTIKRPGGDRVFPESPKDFEIVPEFAEWAENFFGESEIFIASNQRGVEFERKTEDFLREEVERLLLHVQCFDIKVSKGCFATGKTRVLLVDENGFLDCQVEDSPAKPSAKMAEILLPRDDSGFPEGQVWIVGDAHTDERSEDWEFAQNIAKEYLVEDILYIPIEMLPLCWRLAVR